MLHVYQFSLCVGGTETGPPQLLCDQGPSLTLHTLTSFAPLVCFFTFLLEYTVCRFLLFSQRSGGFHFVWSYFSLFIRMEWMG